MPAQRGKDILVRQRTAVGPPAVYTAMAGIRARTITLNGDTVDVTDSDSVGRWRELLGGAATKSMAVSGNGVFKAGASDEKLRATWFGDQIDDFELVIPGFGTFGGLYQVTTVEYAGDHDGEATYSFALESAGPITFTPLV